MFICRSCANTEHQWLFDANSGSYGSCEICGKVAGCQDIPSSYIKRKPVLRACDGFEIPKEENNG